MRLDEVFPQKTVDLAELEKLRKEKKSEWKRDLLFFLLGMILSIILCKFGIE